MPSGDLTIQSIHVDAALTMLARGYNPPQFVAERILPVVSVLKESDVYYVFNKEELQRQETLRADTALANEFTWDVTSASYLAHEYALRKIVSDRVKRNADPPVRPSITTTRKLKDNLLMDQELRVQAIVQSTAVITNTAVPAIRWDQATAIIEEDVDTAKEQVLLNAGVMPNAWLMNFQTANVVKRWLKAQAQTTYAEWLSKNMLPPVLWGLETIVGVGVQNTANPAQTEVLANIWNDNSLIFHKQSAPSLEDPSLGYILRAQEWEVKVYREEARKGDWHECSVIEDEVLVQGPSGYLWENVLT